MNERTLSRRHLLAGFAMAPMAKAQTPPKWKVSVFSKHLQFLDGENLVKAIAGMGYDGVDLSVRKGGHVEPERVRQDLPRLFTLFKQHGVAMPMITTDIVDASSPHAEDMLGVMQQLGIRYYRWGGFKWTESKSSTDRTFAQQIEDFKPRVAKLAALNSKYQATAMYHTHSGPGLVGASIWDLHEILSGFDPHAVGINYDIGHATVEGGFGGWIDSFHICGEHLRGIAVKDFLWEKDAKGEWKAEWKPLGEGMVRFKQFFAMVAASNFNGPLQLHFEYPLGGADAGKRNPTMPKDQILAAMKKDLTTLRGYLAS